MVSTSEKLLHLEDLQLIRPSSPHSPHHSGLNFCNEHTLQAAISAICSSSRSCLKISGQNTNLPYLINFPEEMMMNHGISQVFAIVFQQFHVPNLPFKSQLTRTVRLYDPDPLFEDRRDAAEWVLGFFHVLPKQRKVWFIWFSMVLYIIL